MTRSKIKVGINGLGRWGKNLLRVLEPRCEVFLCRDWSSYEAMIVDPKIDAVVIATPMRTHAAFAERALRAGKHVFVEKPMATDVDSARLLVELAEARGLTLFVGHQFLYHPVFERLQEIVRANKIKYLQCVWRKFGTFDSDMVWNLASHEISIALALFKCLPQEKSEILHHFGLVTKTDVFIARMHFNGTPFLIDLDRCAPEKQLAGPSNIVTVALEYLNNVLIWNDTSLFWLGKNGDKVLICEAHEESIAREMDAFLASCSSGKPALTDGRHGLAVVQVLNQLVGDPTDQ